MDLGTYKYFDAEILSGDIFGADTKSYCGYIWNFDFLGFFGGQSLKFSENGKNVNVKAIGGSPGSFLQVKLISKYSILQSDHFLRN